MKRLGYPAPCPLGFAVVLVVATFAAAAGPASQPPADPPSAPDGPDCEVLHRNKVELTVDALLGVVQRACGKDVPAAEIAAEVTKLGSPRYAVREAAAARLTEMGPVVVRALRRASASEDAELAQRARELTDRIIDANGSATLGPAVRVLARRRELTAVEPLVKLVPFAHDPDLEADIWYGLEAIARRHPGTVERVGRALADPAPARRALAAHVLARHGTADGRDRVAAVLTDPDPHVRLRAAQGLLAARDARGVPALIDLLADDEPPVRWEAADLLRWLADPGPAVPGAGSNRTDCQRCREAWAGWWAERRAGFDLAKAFARPARPGLQVVIDLDDYRVALVGGDGTRYWSQVVGRGLADARPVGPGLVVLRRDGTDGTELTTHDWSAGQTSSRTHEVDLRSVARRADGGWVALQATDPRVTNPRYYVVGYTRQGDLAGHVRPPENLDGLEGVRALPDGRVLVGHGLKPDGREGTIGRLVAYDAATGRSREVLPNDVSGIEPLVEQTPAGDFLGVVRSTGADPTAHVYRFDGGEKATWRVECPRAEHATGTRTGLVLVSLPGRMGVYAADGRCVAEVPVGGSVDRAFEAFPLGRLGFDPAAGVRVEDTVAYRVRGLKSANPAERRMSAEALAEMGPRGVGATAALREAKKDADELVRSHAERALFAVGDERLQRLLAEEVTVGSDEARVKLILEMNAFRSSGEVATRLLERLKHPSAKVRAQAANVLGGFELDADRIIPALIRTVEDKDREVRLMSLHSLIRFGKKSAVAVPHIHHCVKDSNPQEACWALGVVRVVGPIQDQATFDLVADRVMNGPSGEIQYTAVFVLSRTKIHADRLPAFLMKAVDSGRLRREYRNEDPYLACLKTLGGVVPPDPKVVRLLTEELANTRRHRDQRLAAAETLTGIGSPAKTAIPTFRQILQEESDRELLEPLARLLEKLQKATAGPVVRP